MQNLGKNKAINIHNLSSKGSATSSSTFIDQIVYRVLSSRRIKDVELHLSLFVAIQVKKADNYVHYAITTNLQVMQPFGLARILALDVMKRKAKNTKSPRIPKRSPYLSA